MFVSIRWRSPTQAVPTLTFCPTPLWQISMRATQKLRGLSFPSSQPTSLVGESKHFIGADIIGSAFPGFVRRHVNRKETEQQALLLLLLFAESTKVHYHSDSIMIWQVPQTLATYHTSSLGSIPSSTSAPTR